MNFKKTFLLSLLCFTFVLTSCNSSATDNNNEEIVEKETNKITQNNGEKYLEMLDNLENESNLDITCVCYEDEPTCDNYYQVKLSTKPTETSDISYSATYRLQLATYDFGSSKSEDKIIQIIFEIENHEWNEKKNQWEYDLIDEIKITSMDKSTFKASNEKIYSSEFIPFIESTGYTEKEIIQLIEWIAVYKPTSF